ncbi:hypothetical protein TNIN_219231 [Trichonephila inaurata madagascariensis]|uniref:Uncharacterized protein n=1 Tax=Trichonephila inaurata madagascariensis TaxID=2747483 RepID=A0A8X6WZD7_9ARAC|nr:hypothetical protein TNIN_219231 [Trichonephila inaurata madagascariensis]
MLQQLPKSSMPHSETAQQRNLPFNIGTHSNLVMRVTIDDRYTAGNSCLTSPTEVLRVIVAQNPSNTVRGDYAEKLGKSSTNISRHLK